MGHHAPHWIPSNTPWGTPSGILHHGMCTTGYPMGYPTFYHGCVYPMDCTMKFNGPNHVITHGICSSPCRIAWDIAWDTVGQARHPVAYHGKRHGVRNHGIYYGVPRPMGCSMRYPMRCSGCYTMGVSIPWMPKEHPVEDPMGHTMVSHGYPMGYSMVYPIPRHATPSPRECIFHRFSH